MIRMSLHVCLPVCWGHTFPKSGLRCRIFLFFFFWEKILILETCMSSVCFLFFFHLALLNFCLLYIYLSSPPLFQCYFVCKTAAVSPLPNYSIVRVNAFPHCANPDRWIEFDSSPISPYRSAALFDHETSIQTHTAATTTTSTRSWGSKHDCVRWWWPHSTTPQTPGSFILVSRSIDDRSLAKRPRGEIWKTIFIKLAFNAILKSFKWKEEKKKIEKRVLLINRSF